MCYMERPIKSGNKLEASSRINCSQCDSWGKGLMKLLWPGHNGNTGPMCQGLWQQAINTYIWLSSSCLSEIFQETSQLYNLPKYRCNIQSDSNAVCEMRAVLDSVLEGWKSQCECLCFNLYRLEFEPENLTPTDLGSLLLSFPSNPEWGWGGQQFKSHVGLMVASRRLRLTVM